MWVYILTNDRDSDGNALWSVGFYAPNGKWVDEDMHCSREEASKWVNYLNGGTGKAIAT